MQRIHLHSIQPVHLFSAWHAPHAQELGVYISNAKFSMEACMDPETVHASMQK